MEPYGLSITLLRWNDRFGCFKFSWNLPGIWLLWFSFLTSTFFGTCCRYAFQHSRSRLTKAPVRQETRVGVPSQFAVTSYLVALMKVSDWSEIDLKVKFISGSSHFYSSQQRYRTNSEVALIFVQNVRVATQVIYQEFKELSKELC